MRGHNLVRILHLALARESARPWASSRPGRAARMFHPSAHFLGAGASCASPAAPPHQPRRQSSQSAAGSRKHRWQKCPYRGSANHGGIIFISTACAIGRRPRPRLLVGHQRHRRNFARPMATLAVILQDGQHIFIEGRRRSSRTGPASRHLPGGGHEQEQHPPRRGRQISSRA